MNDEDNPTLGDKQEDTAPSATPTDNKVPETDLELPSDQDVNIQGTGDEAATTDKPGSGEDESQTDSSEPRRSRAAQRIGELIRENKSLRRELEGGEDEETQGTSTPQTSLTKTGDTPEYNKARDFLKNLGFQPKDEVENVVEEKIQDMEARMILDSEKSRLENKYSGDDGRPAYDHDKVMKHARQTGIYNPEVAYENLYKAELTDWAIKNAKSPSSTYTEKPTSSATPETGQLTRESLARILSTPEGRKWYENNREKVLSALSQGEL